ncbi:uncharacterized protein LOC135401561 [Ornithodoros turicata]|uniref:uncharacterized protein LOC135401561 n=1 Tax=Ornithodoros turicata TaxID=34597 RepID=UPI00313A3F8F
MEIHHHLDGEDLEKNLYHDSDKMASLMMSTEGGLRVEGIIGSNLRIRPLDARERSSEGDTGHLVYQVKERMSRSADILYAPGKEFDKGASTFVKPVHGKCFSNRNIWQVHMTSSLRAVMTLT